MGKKVIGITIFGLDEAAVSSVLDTVTKVCTEQSAYAVLLSDSDAFHHFRSRNLAFEYLPSADQRESQGQDLDWPLYFRRRLGLFRDKWRPDVIISFGTREPVEGFRGLLERLEAEN